MTFRSFSVLRTWLLAVSSLLLLGACSVPTPYQAADGGYGYKDQQIEENRYRVSFDGNSLTPREDVQNFLLYRAAELTVESDFDYFTIVDRDLERSTRYFSQAIVDDFAFRRFSRRRFNSRRFIGPRFVSGTTHSVNEYSGSADIVMKKGDKPTDDANAYDALDVLQRLQPSIRQSTATE